MKVIKILLLAILIIIAKSCEKDDNQLNFSITGTWKGIISSSLIGNTEIMIIISQDGTKISGNYYSERSVGTIAGSIDGSALKFTLTQTSSYCTGTFTGSGSISESNITFNFQGTDCLGTHTNGKGNITKESSNVTLPIFSQVDLIGNWSGTAHNSQNSFVVNVTVSSNGSVTGSGVNSTWSIDSKGTVTGAGSFSFISGSYLYIASSSWYLQLNDGKESLTGVFDVSITGLHNLEIILEKQ